MKEDMKIKVSMAEDAMEKRLYRTASGTFRVLPPEEVGKRILIDPTALEVKREAS